MDCKTHRFSSRVCELGTKGCEITHSARRRRPSEAEQLLASMRGFETDHAPDGWPAVRMKDISRLCSLVESTIPSLDLLEAHLAAGAVFERTGGRWRLLATDGGTVVSGETLRALLINLIWQEC